MSQKIVVNYHQENPQISNPNLQNEKNENNTTLITFFLKTQ
jgi:hypothetical protein